MKVNETPSLPISAESQYDRQLQQALIGWMRPVARAVNSLIDLGGGGGGGGSAHEIEDEGVPLAQRLTINFSGLGVTVTDTGTKTLVTIPGSGSALTFEDEGVALTQRALINFVGAGVTVTDSGSKTVVTIPGGGGSGSSYFPSGW